MAETIYPGMVQMVIDIPSWKCSSCNFVFRGGSPPKVCPLCRKETDFEKLNEFRDFSDINND